MQSKEVKPMVDICVTPYIYEVEIDKYKFHLGKAYGKSYKFVIDGKLKYVPNNIARLTSVNKMSKVDLLNKFHGTEHINKIAGDFRKIKEDLVVRVSSDIIGNMDITGAIYKGNDHVVFTGEYALIAETIYKQRKGFNDIKNVDYIITEGLPYHMRVNKYEDNADRYCKLMGFNSNTKHDNGGYVPGLRNPNNLISKNNYTESGLEEFHPSLYLYDLIIEFK